MPQKPCPVVSALITDWVYCDMIECCLVHFWLCDQLSADQICGKINLVHISAWQVVVGAVVHTECMAKIVLIFYNPLDLSFIYVLNLTVTNIIISVFVRRMTFHARTQCWRFDSKRKKLRTMLFYYKILDRFRNVWCGIEPGWLFLNSKDYTL